MAHTPAQLSAILEALGQESIRTELTMLHATACGNGASVNEQGWRNYRDRSRELGGALR